MNMCANLAGMACALLSGMLFMLSATFFGMPVSTTHAIVGAVLGMTMVGAGAACVNWGYPGLLTIVASWFVSPLLAGALSAAMHVAIQTVVFKVLSCNRLPSRCNRKVLTCDSKVWICDMCQQALLWFPELLLPHQRFRACACNLEHSTCKSFVMNHGAQRFRS